MTKASDNPYPSLLITEGTVPATPAAGKQRLYIDSTTHVLKYVNSAGTASNVAAAGSGSITASGYTQTTARLLGRTTASTGAVEEITVGAGLSLSAGSLTASSAFPTILNATASTTSGALTTGAFRDIITLSVTAGTWLMWATTYLENTSGGGMGGSIKLYESGGGTVYQELGIVIGNGFDVAVTLTTPPIVIGSTTTVRLAVSTNATITANVGGKTNGRCIIAMQVA